MNGRSPIQRQLEATFPCDAAGEQAIVGVAAVSPGQHGSLVLFQHVFSPTSHHGIRLPPHSTRHRLPASANPQRTAMLATYFILLVSDAGMLVLGL